MSSTGRTNVAWAILFKLPAFLIADKQHLAVIRRGTISVFSDRDLLVADIKIFL
jgi:hypothetical protein